MQKILILFSLLFLAGCQEEPNTQSLEDPADSQAQQSSTSLPVSKPLMPMETMPFMEPDAQSLSFAEELTAFKTLVAQNPEDPFLIQKAEGLWIDAPRKSLKERLELAFWLMKAFRRQGDISRAEEYASEYRRLGEALQGGSAFHEHRRQVESVEDLSKRWGEEP